MINYYALEFYAYNIGCSSITYKTYAKVWDTERNQEAEPTLLGEDDCRRINHALDYANALDIPHNRYSLYDISLRKSENGESVSLCYKDTRDYEDIDPEDILNGFQEIDCKSFTGINKEIMSSLFERIPHYNPIFMIGIEIAHNSMMNLKTYIRFDIEDLSLQKKRCDAIKRIVRTIGRNESSAYHFGQIAQFLEDHGLVFCFIGIDCSTNDSIRYKVYFKYNSFSSMAESPYETIISSGILDEAISKDTHSNDDMNIDRMKIRLNEIFRKHDSLLWGIALSTKGFDYINGLQLCFYPRALL